MKESRNRPFPEFIEHQYRQERGEAVIEAQEIIHEERINKRNDKLIGIGVIIAISLALGVCLIGPNGENPDASGYVSSSTPERVLITYTGTPGFYTRTTLTERNMPLRVLPTETPKIP